MFENKKRHKKMILSIMLLSALMGLVVGIVIGIELYQTVSNRLGYWRGTVEATKIIILSIRHQIQATDRIRTTISLGNVDDHAISCNCTIYYKATGGQDLSTYSFNATISAGQTYSRTFSVQPINITRWTGTDTSIYEY
jgi:hypothetical protein